MIQPSIVILVTLVLYKLILIGIGVWASKRAGTEAGFLIGGRSLGPWVAGLSYAATSSSAWVLLGFSGFVYAVGLSALWMLPGIWFGYVFIWILLGGRIRSESAEKSYITPTDFIAAGSTGTARKAIALLATAMIVFCFIFYIAAQLQAAGVAMQSFFGIDLAEAVLIGAAVVLIYSLLGGFWAVSVTDMLQGAVMAALAIAAPLAAVVAAGGPGAVLQALINDSPGHLALFGGRSGLAALGFVVGISSIGLGTVGQPQLLARVMSVRDDKARRQAFAISLAWAVAVFSAMAVLGLAGRALPVSTSGEDLLFTIVGEYFPPVMAGVALAALLSAIMSTVDSILLSSAAAITHDAGVNRAMPGREVLTARLVMTGLTVIAILLTLKAPATIFERVLFAWAALGAALGPTVVARVLDWRPHPWAVVAAMVVGFALAVIFNQILPSGEGAILERLLPWLPTLALLYLARQPAAPPRV